MTPQRGLIKTSNEKDTVMARKTLMVQDKTSSADVSRHEQYFGPRHGEPQSRLRTCSVASLWRNDNVMNYIVAPAATN